MSLKLKGIRPHDPCTFTSYTPIRLWDLDCINMSKVLEGNRKKLKKNYKLIQIREFRHELVTKIIRF